MIFLFNQVKWNWVRFFAIEIEPTVSHLCCYCCTFVSEFKVFSFADGIFLLLRKHHFTKCFDRFNIRYGELRMKTGWFSKHNEQRAMCYTVLFHKPFSVTHWIEQSHFECSQKYSYANFSIGKLFHRWSKSKFFGLQSCYLVEYIERIFYRCNAMICWPRWNPLNLSIVSVKSEMERSEFERKCEAKFIRHEKKNGHCNKKIDIHSKLKCCLSQTFDVTSY